MSPDAYRHLSTKLRQYLKTDINFEILANFLRQNNKIQKCFQLVHNAGGKSRYIEAEKAFHYEHGSKSRIGDATQAKLLNEIDIDEYYTDPLTGRFVLDEIESFFKNNRNISIDSRDNIEQLKGQLSHCCYNVEEVIDDLINFCRTNPRLPDTAKKWVQMDPINIDHCTTRDEIVDYLESIRATNEVADLAFMAYRDMSRSPWKPFIKAALERSPAGIDGATELDIGQVAEKLWMMANQSIYDGSRMAQPDEVWNFERGDGLEKALCLMNIIKSRFPDDEITLKGDNTTICLVHRQNEYLFQTTKKVPLPEKDDFIF
jgi:hypothetical protein